MWNCIYHEYKDIVHIHAIKISPLNKLKKNLNKKQKEIQFC